MVQVMGSSSYNLERTQLLARASGRRSDRANIFRRPRKGERAISILLFGAGLLSIFTTLFIVFFLGTEAVAFFQSRAWVHARMASASAAGSQPVTLVEAMPADTQRIILADGAGAAFQAGTVVKLESEIMRVAAVDGNTLTVERGLENTLASSHAAAAALEVERRPDLLTYFTGTVWQPQTGNFGVLPLIEATLMTSLVAMLVALPVGLAAAIYLSEYASLRVRNILNPLLEILVGVPTVVYGFFALQFVTLGVLRPLFGVDIYNTLAAGIVVGIMVIPTIASMSVDAMGAVPRGLRDASYGLGATRLETIIKVVLPAALSGIMAAVILGISRAVGETMIVAIAAGAGPNWTFPPNFAVGAETMTGHIARISGGDLSYQSVDYNSIFSIGMTLFVITFALTQLSATITRRFREKYE